MKQRSILAILGFVLITSAFSSAWLSQSQNGTISGTITDESKNVIPGVTVTAVDAQGEKRSTVISDENGKYSLAGLQPGTYTVTAVLPGFETATVSGFALASQGQSPLNFTLKIASRRGGFMPLPPATAWTRALLSWKLPRHFSKRSLTHLRFSLSNTQAHL